MNNYLMINDVIKYSDERYVRIIWIESDNSFCYVIQLFINKLDIRYVSIESILNELNNQICEIVEDNSIRAITEEIGEKQMEILTKANNIVEEIFSVKNEPNCYSEKYRRRIILSVAEEYGVSEKSVYKYVRKYLQGGKIKYSLLNDYYKCGGNGKRKRSIDSKRGRPHNLTKITGESIGINVDDDIEKIFRIALNRYYLNTKQRSLIKTYRMMLKDFFSYEEITENTKCIKIKQVNNIPSLNQFKYWFYKNKDIEKIMRSRIGDKKFDLNYKRLRSDSTYETMGPGVRYQIDATIGDVYLVSRIDRKSVIGRPVVYLVIDVFSRMITGVSVALEGPSWNGASTALYNCMEDKVQYCKKFGLDIKKEDWNVKGLPQTLIGDRGELVGPIAEKVIENLKISIENTPSYMGCAKGIVEQYFHVINTEIKHWLPGEVKKGFKERGERDYRKDAKLDIMEFTKIIILAVIKRNKTIMKDYPLTEEMINDGIKPTPSELWEWGLKNKTGNLRSLPEKILVLNLLKSGRATIQRDGIRFKGLLYNCLIAEEQKWFLNTQIKGVKGIDVRYDDRDMSSIYLVFEHADYVKAELIVEKTSNTAFMAKTLQEVEDYNYNKSIKNLEYTDEMNNLNLDFDLEIEKIIKNAEKGRINTNNVLKDINENRRIENYENKEYHKLINVEDNKSSNIMESGFNGFSIDNSEDEDEVKNSLFRRLKKAKEKKLNDL